MSFEKFKKLNADLNLAQQAIRDEGMAALELARQELFHIVPELEKVVISIYTPSFNDGSPCLPSFTESKIVLKPDQYQALGVHPEDHHGEDLIALDNSEEPRAQIIYDLIMHFIVLIEDIDVMMLIFELNNTITFDSTQIHTKWYDCGY